MPNIIKAAPWLVPHIEQLQTDPTFLAEDLVLDVCEQIHAVMADEGINQKELASRLGISQSAVSQLLSGDQNISLRRLVEVALALGRAVRPPQLVAVKEAVIEADEGLSYIFTLPAHVEPDRSWKAWTASRSEQVTGLHATIRPGLEAGPELSLSAPSNHEVTV